MKKYAKYVGESNELLINGKVYEISTINLSTKRITLSGINGIFHADLFEDVLDPNQKQTYIAFAKVMPEIGKEMFLIRIENGSIQPVNISTIIDISYVEGDIYRIETENSVYITEISA